MDQGLQRNSPSSVSKLVVVMKTRHFQALARYSGSLDSFLGCKHY